MPARPSRTGTFDYPFVMVATQGDTTYKTASVFCFQGTDDLGIPKSITAVCGHTSAQTQTTHIRIYDVTNNQVICERTDITDPFPTAVDMGTLSNVHTAPAIWEVQIKRPGGGAPREVAVASLHMEH